MGNAVSKKDEHCGPTTLTNLDDESYARDVGESFANP